MPAAGPLKPYWSTRCSNFYGCHVDADGTFQAGPPAWLCERTGEGVYEITHNLGTTEYLPLVGTASVMGDYRVGSAIQAREADKVRVETFDSVQLADMAFVLMIFTL